MRDENKRGIMLLVSKIRLRSFLDRRSLLSVNEKTAERRVSSDSLSLQLADSNGNWTFAGTVTKSVQIV